MALSDREQQMLEQMERALASEDPRFASTFSGVPTVAMPPRNLGYAVLAILAGLAALIAGVAIAQPAIGILGFLVVVGALTALLTSISRPAARPASSTTPARRSFMQGLEERWDRRSDDQ